MNFRPLVIAKLKEFSEKCPALSFGELMFSIVSSMKRGADFDKTDLLKVSDQDMYTCIERSIKKEIGND